MYYVFFVIVVFFFNVFITFKSESILYMLLRLNDNDFVFTSATEMAYK